MESLKARIRKFALSSPGEYFILDQKAGRRFFVTPLGSQIGYPIIESRNARELIWVEKAFSWLGVF
jgi:hypothetical protein